MDVPDNLRNDLDALGDLIAGVEARLTAGRAFVPVAVDVPPAPPLVTLRLAWEPLNPEGQRLVLQRDRVAAVRLRDAATAERLRAAAELPRLAFDAERARDLAVRGAPRLLDLLRADAARATASLAARIAAWAADTPEGDALRQLLGLTLQEVVVEGEGLSRTARFESARYPHDPVRPRSGTRLLLRHADLDETLRAESLAYLCSDRLESSDVWDLLAARWPRAIVQHAGEALNERCEPVRCWTVTP